MLAVGAITVGTTMHLVNAQGNLKLLSDLDLQKRPEIPEENILPETPPKPASPEPSESSDNEATQVPAAPPAPSTTGTEATKNSQESSSSEAADLIKFIQIKAKEIHDSN